MSIFTEPRVCTVCGGFAPWMLEDLDGAGIHALARACDSDLVEVMRERTPTGGSVVLTELLPHFAP